MEEEQEESADRRLNHLLNHVLLFLRGEEDGIQFESGCRELIGAGGYVLYTVDKVVTNCLKGIHNLFSDTMSNDVVVSVGSRVECRPVMSSSSSAQRHLHSTVLT